jgi:hypothetical protein
MSKQAYQEYLDSQPDDEYTDDCDYFQWCEEQYKLKMDALGTTGSPQDTDGACWLGSPAEIAAYEQYALERGWLDEPDDTAAVRAWIDSGDRTEAELTAYIDRVRAETVEILERFKRATEAA